MRRCSVPVAAALGCMRSGDVCRGRFGAVGLVLVHVGGKGVNGALDHGEIVAVDMCVTWRRGVVR